MLNIPAVSSSVGFIAGTIASLPIRLYRTEGGNSVEVTGDYRLRLLNEETGDLLDAFQWKCTLVRDYLLTGNGYTYVNWAGNRIDGLYYVDPMQVSVEIGADPIYKTARFYIGGTLLLLAGVQDASQHQGRGRRLRVVEESPTQLETMLNTLRYENHMVRTGGKKGFLKAKNRLATDVIQQLKNSWRNLYGNDSEESVVVLNDGIEFQDASQTAVESQLNENKTTNDHEILRFSTLSLCFGGRRYCRGSENTVRFAIQPVVKALQTAINRYCLLESEKEAFSLRSTWMFWTTRTCCPAIRLTR